MDRSKGFKYRGTFASEASGPQKLEKLHLGGNLKFKMDMGLLLIFEMMYIKYYKTVFTI